MKKHPLARTTDLIMQTTNNEILIYNLKTNQAFCLNETSAVVWNLCDGNHSVSEISNQIGNEEIVWLALDKLNEIGLLTEEFEANERFAGLSRREIIQKAGLSSAMSLPLVSTLIAPRAVAAQSVNNNCTVACVNGCNQSCACLAPTGVGNPCGQGLAGIAQQCELGCLCISFGTLVVGSPTPIEEGVCM